MMGEMGEDSSRAGPGREPTPGSGNDDRPGPEGQPPYQSQPPYQGQPAYESQPPYETQQGQAPQADQAPWAPPPGQGSGPPEAPPAAPYQGYPAQYGYAAAPARPNAGSAVAVGVLGIGSLVVLFTCLIGFIPAIIALVLAPGAQREIEQSGGRLGGEGLIQAGKICSWITLGLTALLLVVAIVAIVAVVVSVETGAGAGTPVPGY